MVEINWTELALYDLRDIHEYISRDSVFYAGRQIEKLIKRVEQLETNPKSGRVVPEFDNLSVRELIEGNYRIVYQINSSKSISIIRIHHSARELK